jgi:hypothetical protein
MISLLMGGVSSAALISSLSGPGGDPVPGDPIEIPRFRTMTVLGSPPNCFGIRKLKHMLVLGARKDRFSLTKGRGITILGAKANRMNLRSTSTYVILEA